MCPVQHDQLFCPTLVLLSLESRHVQTLHFNWPALITGFVLGGRVMFYDNYFTGSGWVSRRNSLRNHCLEPDPPYLATQKEIDEKYQPMRIRGLDFSGIFYSIC